MGPGMKAVQFDAHGDRDVIEYGDFPDPSPTAAKSLSTLRRAR